MNLKDELFYVIVFGPDYGECIVLRVPPETAGGPPSWLVVDSLERDDDAGTWHPALDLLAGSQWSALLLTHPHDDHAAGFGAVVNHPGGGPIGCTELAVDPPAAWKDSNDAEHLLRKGSVEHALAAIQDRWEREPASRWEIRAASSREIGGARLTVLFPDEATVAKHTAGPPRNANRLASPILVEWHDARVVLGSDLVSTDWRKLPALSALSGLGFPLRPHGFKIAHHGSDAAVPPAKTLSHRADAIWVLTPFWRGRGLPSYADGGGVELLLRLTPEVHVTRCPALDVPHIRSSAGGTVLRLTRQALMSKVNKRKVASGLVVDSPIPATVRGAWVATGFDASGRLVDVQHGDASLVVSEGATRSTPARSGGPGQQRPKRPKKPDRTKGAQKRG